MFETGTLWDKICAVTQRALRSGDLRPIPTSCEYVEDGGVRFLVRIVDNSARKRSAGEVGTQSDSRRRNPFLPYNPQLYVGDASETHVCLLNKYNVVDHHLLIVTRDFEHQDQTLTFEDFQALGRCMTEYDGLGFYNSGTVAGASQAHKHLQLVPLPMAADGPRVPIEPLLEVDDSDAASSQNTSLPFPHAVERLDPRAVLGLDSAAQLMLNTYFDLLQAVGIPYRSDADSQVDKPYNLLVTRQWMLLVPRTRESFETISLNSLAFAGALLVRNQQELDLLKTSGPMQALRHATSS